MKAIFYTPIIRPGGGPGGYLYNLYTASKRERTQNEFIFHGRIYEEKKYNNHKYWPLQLKAQIYLHARMIYAPVFSDYRKLLNLADQADVMVFHGPIHPIQLLSIRKRCKTIVFMPHSPSTWADEYVMEYAAQKRAISKKRYEMYKWAELMNFTYADNVVFPSFHASESYRAAYPDQIKLVKIHHIESGITLPSAMPELNPLHLSEKLRIGFVGRYNKHKGFDLFLEATKKLRNRSDIEIICAGSGAMKVSPYVKNLGWVNDTNNLLSKIQIVVVPNRVAYFDLWPLEAAAAGKPIVFTPAGGNIDQHKALPDSIIASDITAEALETAIEKAIGRIKTDPHWGTNNRAAYLDRFTAEAMLSRWDAFISKLDE